MTATPSPVSHGHLSGALLKATPFLCAILMAGCTTRIVPAGPDTYAVSSRGAGYSAAYTRSNAYEAADKFCRERGLVMVPLTMNAQDGAPFKQPSTELIFRALKPGDPEIKRPSMDAVMPVQRVQIR